MVVAGPLLDEEEKRLAKKKRKHKKEHKEKKSDKKDKKKKEKKKEKKIKKKSKQEEPGATKRRDDVPDDEDDKECEDESSHQEDPQPQSLVLDAVGTSHKIRPRPLVESSALPPSGASSCPRSESSTTTTAMMVLEEQDDLPVPLATATTATCTLLLFYQYVEPAWSDASYQIALRKVRQIAEANHLTGRMRVAKEGLNCTLSGQADQVRQFCFALRHWQPMTFQDTEFKLTHDVPIRQQFKELKLLPVSELVHYGLDGDKAPPLLSTRTGGGSGGGGEHTTHLEPVEYHAKLSEPDTVVIDVRNHYEATIGHFDTTTTTTATTTLATGNGGVGGAEYVDPKMRKSTEFPIWLDDPATKEKLKGKQVLMYCTGGIRCERASALLRYKMEHDPEVKALGIKGVYQLQGGIDKYFKAFPDGGGYWKGKNYTFDKRFAHEPTAMMTTKNNHSNSTEQQPIGKCEACRRPWDRYGGKRRCPACGVPSLICKDCYNADQNGTKKLDKTIRCDLCVEQGIFSKTTIRQREAAALQQYEARQREKGLMKPVAGTTTTTTSTIPMGIGQSSDERSPSSHLNKRLAEESSSGSSLEAANPDQITRLYLKNMCRKNMTEEILMEHFPCITHIVWNTRLGAFLGQGWVEMESPVAAAEAVARSGEIILGRPLYIEYQAADAKDVWPPSKSAVR